MQRPDKLLLFHLDEHSYALDLSVVERVLRSLEITPVPKAPCYVSGVIDMNGRIIPVINIRLLLGLPDREIELDDHLIIASAGGLPVALPADEVAGVAACKAEDFIAGEDIFPDIGELQGLVQLADGLTLIYDLQRFLAGDNLAAFREAPVAVAGDEAPLISQAGPDD